MRFRIVFDAGPEDGCLIDAEDRSGAGAGDGLAEALSDVDAGSADFEDFVGLEVKAGSKPQDQCVSSD